MIALDWFRTIQILAANESLVCWTFCVREFGLPAGLTITKHGPHIHCYVWENYPEQSAVSARDRRGPGRARQPLPRLVAALERRAQPGAAGYPAQPPHGRGIARPAALAPDPVLVRGSQGRPQTDQREVRDSAHAADFSRRVPAAGRIF